MRLLQICLLLFIVILGACSSSSSKDKAESQKVPDGLYQRDEFENIFLGKPEWFIWKRLGTQDKLMFRGAFKKSTIYQYNQITYLKDHEQMDNHVLLFMSIDGNSVLDIKFN